MEMEKECRRMEDEIRAIARNEGLGNVEIEWGDPPIVRSPEGRPLKQVDGLAARVSFGVKNAFIIFDNSELRDFAPESEPEYLQRIREKIRQKLHELE